MKIVCQSCQAKYSIADDKVQGKKVFKIKCKKCGEDILVRGAEGGEAESTGSHAAQEPFTEDEATKVVSAGEAAAAADAGWHAVVNGNQEGPFTVQQLRDMVGGGSLDGEAFVWKDGFAEWKPLKDVPELATLVLGGRSAPPPAAGGGGGDLFAGGGGGGGGGGGMFGGDEARARTSAKASSAKGDLFATEAAAAKGGMFGGGGGEEEVSTSASAKPAASAASMTGARNENSVLFSLASLQAIAGSGTGPARVAEPGAAGKKSDADASGIIDIKSMGSSMGPGGGAKSKAVDDLLTVGASSPLGSPLSAPMLAPVPAPTSASPEPERASGGSKSMMVAGVLIALILAGGGIAVAFLLKPSAPPPTVVVNAPPPPVNNNANNGNNGNNNAGANAANPAAPAPGTTVADNTNAAAGTDPANRNDRTRDPHARDPHEHDPHTTAATTPAPATATTPPPASNANSSGCAARCHGNIDCLLRCTAGGGGGSTTASNPPPQQQAAPSNAPETPSRNDVISAMGRVRGAVANCAGGQTGTATMSITFGSNGHVNTATASGAPFAGTPAGSCMARAVRSATVPPFTRPSFSVTYPFRI